MKKIFILIAISLWAMLSHAQLAETRVALVIGNSAYKNSPLKNPVNDAADMSARLKGFGFTVIERNNLTTKQIGSTLREFRSKLTPGSVALVFYAGHGVTIKGKNYLPAVDAEINGEEDVPNQSLGTEQIMDVLAEAKTRLNLVFLDACRDNPYARGFRTTSRGLSRESAPSGTLISFATKPGSVAADGTGRNGLYTSVLLEQLKSSGQPIEQVLKKVVTGVRVASKNQQEPWMEGSIEGDFCFGSCSQNSGSQVPAELTDSQKEERFWEDVKSTANKKAFEAYIKKYPNGQFVDLARANIDRITLSASSNNDVLSTSNQNQNSGTIDEIITIKIGHVAPLSGAIAHLGKDNENGATLAIEDLNRRSIRVGNKLANFVLISEDDAAMPKQAIEVAQKLVNQRVVAIVGHLNSGTSIPASKIYSEAGIPQISPSSTNPKFTRQGLTNVFRLVGDDAALGQAMGKMAFKKYGFKKALVIDDKTTYGTGIADTFESGFISAGGKIAKRYFVNDKATDFSTIIDLIRSIGPDLVFFGGMDSVASLMIMQINSQGHRVNFMGGDGICTNDLMQLSGKAFLENQVFCAEAGGVEGPQVKTLDDFDIKFKKRFHSDVQIYAPYVYDAVMVIADAIVRANSINTDSIKQAISTTSYAGITGPIQFDSKGDLKNPPFTLYTYKKTGRSASGIFRVN